MASRCRGATTSRPHHAAADLAWWTTNTDTPSSGQRAARQLLHRRRPDLAGRRPDDGLREHRLEDQELHDLVLDVAAAGGSGRQRELRIQFDSSDWTGEIKASELTFDANGIPQLVEKWTSPSLLATQLAGTGWSSNRRVVTWNPADARGRAVPRDVAVGGTARGARHDLRDGRRQHRLRQLPARRSEQRDPLHRVGSSKAYRNRSVLLGDIVGSKARPVGPPSFPYSDATTPAMRRSRDLGLAADGGLRRRQRRHAARHQRQPGAARRRRRDVRLRARRAVSGAELRLRRSTASRRSATRRSRTTTSSMRPRTSTTSTSGARPTAPGRPRRVRRTGARS